MVKRQKDNCVKMLYRMENTILTKGMEFGSITDAQKYVDFVTGSDYWRTSPDSVPQAVKVFSNGDNRYSYCAEPNEVWLAIGDWNQQVVLHELAHFFADGHGPKFVRAYLNLISHFMGLELAKKYRQAFKLVGVKF